MTKPPGLLDLLVCPKCRGEFEEASIPTDGHPDPHFVRADLPGDRRDPRLPVDEPASSFLSQKWPRLAEPAHEGLQGATAHGRIRLMALTSRSYSEGDILSSPFRASGFDQCISFCVLHHSPEPRAAFEACWSGLRAGGAIDVEPLFGGWVIRARRAA